MNWYERRAEVLRMAETEPGWGCVRLVHERHIGRVLMFKKFNFRAGFWPADHPLAQMINDAYAGSQLARTRLLPK